jgi:hypothetical protein
MNDMQLDALVKLREDLNGFWSLNWERILSVMKGIELREETRQELALLVLGYIERTMIGGHFGNLEGIDVILDYLNIGDVRPTEEWFRLFAEMDARYDQYFLISMYPGLTNGKLHGGGVFEEIEYVRDLLKKKGAPPEHLTDAYIESLWKMREALIRFKRIKNRSNLRGLSHRQIIEIFRH